MPSTNAPSPAQLERHMKAARKLRAETVAHGLVRILDSASSVVRQAMRRLWQPAASTDPQWWTEARRWAARKTMRV